MAMKLPHRKRAYTDCWSERRLFKRLQAKQDRRAARLDPENAPTKRAYNGWAD